MGCSQSRIENEEAVTRCKERKHFMKKRDYAHGEVQNPNPPSHHVPSYVGPPPPQPPPVDKLLPPPPPPSSLSGDPGVPIQRSASMPIQMPLKGKQRETSTSTIIEDEEEEEEEDAVGSLVRRRSRNYRGSGSGRRSRRELREEEEEEEVEEIVTSTTVRTSAMQSQPPRIHLTITSSFPRRR
ncbi:hypothetical protein GQ457_01G038050 [Hibiscus cannabinus]